MRKLFIPLIVMFALALSLIAPVVQAQEKPVAMMGGALFKPGSPTKFIMMGGGNFSIMSQKTEGDVTAQVVMRETIFYSDNEVGDEFEGVGSYMIVQVFKGPWKFGGGTGFVLAMQTGSNSVNSAFVLEASYSPMSWVDLGIHAQYLPADGPDFQIVAAGLSIKMPG